jgi:DNA-binding MarR family transcriptional regulator
MGSQAIVQGEASDVRRALDALRWIVRELRLAQGSGGQGLSAAQRFVLHALKEQGALSVGDLAERTATDPSSVSVVVRKLHDKGLVSKQPSSGDHRRLMVDLTDAGTRTVEGSPVPIQQVLIERMAQLAPDRLHTLAELLEQVAPPREGRHPAPMFFQEGAGAGRRP